MWTCTSHTPIEPAVKKLVTLIYLFIYLFMFGKFVPSEVSLGSELSTTLVTSVPHTLMLRQFVPAIVLMKFIFKKS